MTIDILSYSTVQELGLILALRSDEVLRPSGGGARNTPPAPTGLHPNRVLLADIIFQAVRKQRPLRPLFAIDEPMHLQTPEAPKLQDSKATSPRAESAQTAISPCFHTAWPRSRHWPGDVPLGPFLLPKRPCGGQNAVCNTGKLSDGGA